MNQNHKDTVMLKDETKKILKTLLYDIENMNDKEIEELHSLLDNITNLNHKNRILSRLKDHYPIGSYTY